jgi:hypothetical protein
MMLNFLMTMATFSSWNSIRKAHHVDFFASRTNLTGKTYYTKSFDPLDCSTKNVIYGTECTLCGLLYVGETRQTLRSRMSQHRYDAKDLERLITLISLHPGLDKFPTPLMLSLQP